MVTDLGASFGAAGLEHHQETSKGNLESYRRSAFIRRLTPELVDFECPKRPAFVALVNPFQYVRRLELRRLGRNVSRADARWAGSLLARLSHNQIRDAFRAADYSDSEVDGFTQIFEERIRELNQL